MNKYLMFQSFLLVGLLACAYCSKVAEKVEVETPKEEVYDEVDSAETVKQVESIMPNVDMYNLAEDLLMLRDRMEEV